VLHSIFGKLSKSQKWSNMTKYSSKLGQGPTGPQHSPVTHPESLWSDQFRLECLELGSSCFDLLQCDNLLLSEFLDHCVIEQSFQVLFCSDDNLFKFSSLAFKFSEQLACLLLDWLKLLGDFHHFTLQRMYLLLGCALFFEPLHSFDWGQSLYLHL
jgi:hypothetical protein